MALSIKLLSMLLFTNPLLLFLVLSHQFHVIFFFLGINYVSVRVLSSEIRRLYLLLCRIKGATK